MPDAAVPLALLSGSLRGFLWRLSRTTAGHLSKELVVALPQPLSGCSGPLCPGARDPDCEPHTLRRREFSRGGALGPPSSGPGRGGGPARRHGDGGGHDVEGGPGRDPAALQALQLALALPAELQKIAAEMFGMEAALFVPTGTMSNLIAVMVHCRERGDEMIVGDLSHLHIYEQGGSAQLAGVHSTTVTTLPDGTFSLDQVEAKIRHGFPDAHYPRSRLLCVENTHNIQGGRVLPLGFLQEVRGLADQYDLKVHVDGARLMNAAVALGVSPETILQHTDTVSVCLSKGLGSPVGTVLAGPGDFVARALRCRKALGGGMRQAGVLAAAGKLSLQTMVRRLEDDHHNARTFARALLDCPALFSVDMAGVETNILRFRLRPDLSPGDFCARMSSVQQGEACALGRPVQVLMYPHFERSVRAVWHLDVSAEDTRWAVEKLRYVAAQLTGRSQS